MRVLSTSDTLISTCPQVAASEEEGEVCLASRPPPRQPWEVGLGVYSWEGARGWEGGLGDLEPPEDCSATSQVS